MPEQSFSVSESTGTITKCYCFRYEILPTWRDMSLHLYSAGTGCPVIHPRTAFPFRCFLWFAGLGWMYNNPNPREVTSTPSINSSWLHLLVTQRTNDIFFNTIVLLLFISWSLSSNRCICHNKLSNNHSELCSTADLHKYRKTMNTPKWLINQEISYRLYFILALPEYLFIPIFYQIITHTSIYIYIYTDYIQYIK
jgi:hypothetical protein